MVMAHSILSYNLRKQVCRQAGLPTETSPCSTCSFILGTEKMPFRGGENIVYALQDHTGKAICMRIQRKFTQATSYILDNEVKFRKAIESLGIWGFQKVIGYCLEGNDLVQAPFLTLEWVYGITLRWTNDSPVDLGDRNKVISAIARITMDLLKIQKHGISAKDYVTDRINRKIERAERHEYRGGSVEGCQRQFSLIDNYWVPDLDEAPHVLVHNDLGPLNIIVDKESNLKSVIDLGWADMVPLQFAAEYPRFLTHEPTQINSGPRVRTVFDWQKKNTDMMKRDRQFYLDCVRERGDCDGGIALDYYQLLARSDECHRFWWFKAINQAGVHEAMCACDWDPVNAGASE